MKGATFIYIIPPPSDQGNGFKIRAVNLASYNGDLCGKKHAGVVNSHFIERPRSASPSPNGRDQR